MASRKQFLAFALGIAAGIPKQLIRRRLNAAWRSQALFRAGCLSSPSVLVPCPFPSLFLTDGLMATHNGAVKIFSAAVGSGIFPLGDFSSFGKPGKKLSREDALLMTCATRIPCNLTNPSDRGSSWSSLLAPSHQCHPYCSCHFDAVRDNHYCYNEHAVSAGTSLNRAIALVALSQILWIEIRGYRSACNLRSA